MRHDFTKRRRAILGILILLAVSDVALAAYALQLSSAPQTGAQISAMERQLKLLQAGIARAQKIKDEMPNTQRDCEKFEGSLLPASTGYSSVSAELGGIAKKSGIQPPDLAFKPTAIPERGLTEVAVDAVVQGDYKNVVMFLNGLQRSTNTYEVESLTLASEKQAQGPANMIKVGLHLKTFFRTAA